MAVDKLVDSTQLDADLTSVANAIRTKGGTSASLAFPADFVSAIGDIPSGGISIDDLATMSEPSGAIETSVSLVANYAFIRNPNITSFKDNTVERIGIEGFRYCTALQSVECANLTILGRPSSAITDTYTLGGCTSLESVKIPKCEHIYGGGILNGCGSSSHKITMALPAIKDAVGFRGSHFVVLDLGPDCPGFKNDATYQGSVTTLIMRRTSSLMTVGNSTAMNGLSADSTVYIPKVFYDHLGDGTADDYKNATNWTGKANTVTWAQIEGSYYETHYGDGTEIPSA